MLMKSCWTGLAGYSWGHKWGLELWDWRSIRQKNDGLDLKLNQRVLGDDDVVSENKRGIVLGVSQVGLSDRSTLSSVWL